MTLTDAQIRALLWLPADGALTQDSPPRAVSSALESLKIYHRDLCEGILRKNARGRIYSAFRLTHAGIEARAALEVGR